MSLIYSILILLALLYFCLQFISSSSNLYYSLWAREHNKIPKPVVINKTFKMQQNYIKCMIILIVTQTAVAIANICAKLQPQIGRSQQIVAHKDNLERYLLVVIFTNINKDGH